MKPLPRRPGLATLLHPGDPRWFLDECWPSRPFLHHASLARLEDLQRAPELRTPRSMLQSKRRSIRVWIKDPDNGSHRTAVVTPTQAEELYASRAVTISIDGIEVPAVSRLTRGLARDIGTPLRGISCNAYLSPAGKGTTALHFDDHEVFALQLRGRKRWSFAPNTHVPNPLEDYAVGTRPSPTLRRLCDRFPDTLPPGAETAVLSPGSVLFLPKGYWHLTETLEESVHLTLAVSSLAWIDLVVDRVRDRLIEQEPWRRTAAGFSSRGPARARARAQISSLLGGLARDLAAILDVKKLAGRGPMRQAS